MFRFFQFFDFLNLKILLDANATFIPKSTKVAEEIQVQFNCGDCVSKFSNFECTNSSHAPSWFEFSCFGSRLGDFQDEVEYNLVNPIILNTVAGPVGGWDAIRFPVCISI